VAHQLDGALMAGYRPRCADCGQARLVSIEDVFGAEPEAPDASVDPAAYEEYDGQRWSRREQLVLELAGTCDCGGRFASDAPLRCPKCRSTELDVEHEGSAD